MSVVNGLNFNFDGNHILTGPDLSAPPLAQNLRFESIKCVSQSFISTSAFVTTRCHAQLCPLSIVQLALRIPLPSMKGGQLYR